MAIKVANTEVISNSRELKNISSVDSGTISVLNSAIDTDSTRGSLTKSFTSGEVASITLSSALSPTPVVSATKEVSQAGLSNGTWNVASDGANYDIENYAYGANLAVSTSSKTLTLSTGSWAAGDVGKRVVGNSGEVVIIAVDASVATYDDSTGTTFPNENTLTSGNWQLFALDFIASGVTLSEGTELTGSIAAAFKLNNVPELTGSFSVNSQESSTPFGVAFSADGTKMFMLGNSTQSVYQYNLSTAFDVTTASYNNVSFSVSSQSSQPFDLTFSTDGTKMYIMGGANDTVYQYNLSTAFDLSTASYANLSKYIASQDSQPMAIVFSLDGTRMYMVGRTNDSVFQYNLSTAFAINTASYASKSFNISAQEANPTSLAISADGTRMFIVGYSGDDVLQYTFDTAFEADTAAYDNIFFSVFSQEQAPRGLTFSTDGTKMYVIGNTSKSVQQYALGAAYLINKNATIPNVFFWNGGQDTSVTGLTFNTDGTKMFVVGTTNDSVFQYNLSTAFAVTTASYNNVSFSVASQETSPQGLTFNTDGTKMFVVGAVSDSVHRYTLSTGFDLSTATVSGVQSFSVAAQEINPHSVVFNNDGTGMYIVGPTNDRVFQYTLSTAFDLTTASLYTNYNLPAGNPNSIAFNNDGTKMFIADSGVERVFQHSLSTAFNVSTASYNSIAYAVLPQTNQPNGLTFNADGTKMYICGPDSEYLNVNFPSGVHEYRLYAPYSIQGRYMDKEFSVASQETNPQGLTFSADGTKMFVVGANDIVYQYNLSTVFDVSTASYNNVSFSVTSQDTIPSGLTFSADGTKMFVIGKANDSVFQYNLSTAFDLTTASYNNVSFSVASQESIPLAITFSADGTKMYVAGANDIVYQYALSTAFDVSTASYNNVSFSVATQVPDPEDIAFNTTGTKMFVLRNNANIHMYALSTPFMVNSAVYVADPIFNVQSLQVSTTGMSFNNDGTKLYIVGYNNDKVIQYNTTFGSTITSVPVVPLSQYVAAVTNSSGQIDTVFWADLNSMTATETLNGANAYYAVAVDGSTFKVVDNTNGIRSIVRNNSGTYQYNSNATYGSETWSNATRNSSFGAFQQAMSVAANQMNSTQLGAVIDANQYTLGATLDLAIVLYTTDATENPVSDGVSINYDANALNQGAVLGTDYDYDFPSSTIVRVTSNAAQNLKIRVV